MIRSSILMQGLVVATAAALASAACSEPSAPAPESAAPMLSVSGDDSPLVCPTEETRSASAVIGAHGGAVELDGYSVALPAGAVQQPTEITLTVPASQYLEVDLRANGHEHYDFAKPVTVTVSYSRCGGDLSGRTLTAWEIDPSTKALLEAMPSHDDKAMQAVIFQTPHFSFFAMAD